MSTEKSDYPVHKYPQMFLGSEVYHWPEFKAFAERLGIAYGHPTMDLNIFIPLDGKIVITHEYVGMDTKVLKRPTQEQIEKDKEKWRKLITKWRDVVIGLQDRPTSDVIPSVEVDTDKPTIVVEKQDSQNKNPFDIDWNKGK